ncbi:MAG: hypothetical protein MR855_01475 [Collinsella sp.]|nr:hypothetical protein [Collinsella sp.]
MLEIVIVVLALGFVGFLITKKVTASAALLAGGMLLLAISIVMGNVDNNAYFPPDSQNPLAVN